MAIGIDQQLLFTHSQFNEKPFHDNHAFNHPQLLISPIVFAVKFNRSQFGQTIKKKQKNYKYEDTCWWSVCHVVVVEPVRPVIVWYDATTKSLIIMARRIVYVQWLTNYIVVPPQTIKTVDIHVIHLFTRNRQIIITLSQKKKTKTNN